MNWTKKDTYDVWKDKFLTIVRRFNLRGVAEEENTRMCLESMTPRLGEKVSFDVKKMALVELAALLKVKVKEVYCGDSPRYKGYRLDTEGISPDFPRITLWEDYDNFSTDIIGLCTVVATAVERNTKSQDEEGKS